MVFLQRPISATMLAIGAIALIAMMLPNLRKGKEQALAG
jgi:putative tricarboxylic transport membrane protein